MEEKNFRVQRILQGKKIIGLQKKSSKKLGRGKNVGHQDGERRQIQNPPWEADTLSMPLQQTSKWNPNLNTNLGYGLGVCCNIVM